MPLPPSERLTLPVIDDQASSPYPHESRWGKANLEGLYSSYPGFPRVPARYDGTGIRAIDVFDRMFRTSACHLLAPGLILLAQGCNGRGSLVEYFHRKRYCDTCFWKKWVFLSESLGTLPTFLDLCSLIKRARLPNMSSLDSTLIPFVSGHGGEAQLS